MKKHTFKIAITLLLTAICILSLFSCKREPPTLQTESTDEPETTIQLGCGEDHNFVDGFCTECGKQETVDVIETLEYTLSEDGTYYIVSGIGTCTDTEITIPAKYNGKPVTVIGQRAFCSRGNITAISLPDSITDIGAYAFEGCRSLKSFTVPKSVKNIGQKAFIGCKIEKVEVKSFGAWCAIDFEDLKSNPMYKGALLTMDGEPISKIVFGETDKEIKRFTFAGCKNLLSVVFSESLTSIGEGAFYGCTSLEQISIPKNTKIIGKRAFENCTQLSEITFDGTLAEWNTISLGDDWNGGIAKYTLKCNDATEIINRFSLGLEYGSSRGVQNALMVTGIGTCTDTEIYIPAMHDGKPVVHIGDECFKGQKQITKIVIPDSVTEISPNAFSECENLKEVVLGSGADYIESLFVGCTSLEKVTIPDGVRFISVSCFRGCTALKSITLPATVSEFHINAFSGCSSLTDIFFKGTKAQFNDIFKDRTWMVGTPLQTVHCSDGDLNYVESTMPSEASFPFYLTRGA